MPTHASAAPAGLVLIACPDEWTARALESVLEPAGYRVLRAATAAAAQQQARAAEPDVIVVAIHTPDQAGQALCRALHEDPAVPPETAVIGMTAAGGSRDERLSWLRAGAWDCLGFPLDAEELLLKLAGYVRMKRQADRARAAALVDETTGLYTSRGLRRRARELLAEAVRLHAELACVMFGADPGPAERGAEPGGAADAALRARVGRLLRVHARLSDTVGWWNGSEFAVLAPATDGAGAERLANRLAEAIAAAPPEAAEPRASLVVRAGYHAVTYGKGTLADPEDLLRRASAALGQARVGKGGARIRRFEERP